MNAFSDASFNYEAYLSDRPRYPPSLYAQVLSFHSGSLDHALDIGCGPGLSAFPLSSHFRAITAVDPSEGMISQGPSAWKAFLSSPDAGPGADRCQVNFLVGSAEALQGVDDGSVDLLIAAQASHWFSYPAFWDSAARVVKSGGSVAMWGYGSNFLPDHPELWEDMAAYMSSTAPGLGPYWPQPGRSIVEGLLQDIPWPEADHQWDLESRQRKTHPLVSQGVPQIEGVPADRSFTMERVQSFAQINAYLRTSSALLRYRKAHPEAASQPRPDDIDRHMEKLRAKVLERRRGGKGGEEDRKLGDDEVRVAWPLGLMCIRRR